MPLEFTKEQQAEIAHWAVDPVERPGGDFLENMVAKIAEFGPVFVRCLDEYAPFFGKRTRVLELGGGQGWASCMLKHRFPDAVVTATDISPHAVASIKTWETALGVHVDVSASCTSDSVPFPDESFDVVFAFAAAHHFRTHRRTFGEIARVLAPGGTLFYFYEPSCTGFVYPFALWRVLRKRPSVPEDVLRYPEICALAHAAGFRSELQLSKNARNRGPVETLYYALLGRLPAVFLWVLPCTMNYRFTKHSFPVATGRAGDDGGLMPRDVPELTHAPT
ncbi:MAG: hypothetical protein NVSMB19_13220 [Vulcanimicrobiaceae bacterium]